MNPTCAGFETFTKVPSSGTIKHLEDSALQKNPKHLHSFCIYLYFGPESWPPPRCCNHQCNTQHLPPYKSPHLHHPCRLAEQAAHKLRCTLTSGLKALGTQHIDPCHKRLMIHIVSATGTRLPIISVKHHICNFPCPPIHVFIVCILLVVVLSLLDF